ncbi:MAG: arginine--tRNA ligase [Desulfurococcales archaeon]|nr:arginine--tRNA ligase [Desulfurococcales archaeon]
MSVVGRGKDPVTRVYSALVEGLSDVLGIDQVQVFRLLQPPPRREYGDLSFPVMRFASKSGVDVESVVESVRGMLWERNLLRFADLRLESGFLNVYFKGEDVADEVFRLLASGWKPSPAQVEEPKVYVVEHTSANPIHPLHLGHARNASLGDSLARMLRARGHKVNVRFYINDMGRQVAVATLGFKILGVSPEDLARVMDVKPDYAVGWVYAVTHNSIDAVEARRKGDTRTLDDALSALARLKEKGPQDYFEKILSGVSTLRDPEGAVSELMKRYEEGLEPEKSLVRRVAKAALEGFKETLSRFGVSFDSWDWESDLSWSGMVARLLEEARKSPYFTLHKGAPALDLPRVIRELVEADTEVKTKIKIPRGFDIPPLILMRSDGTTLYTTRDIAYTLLKFREAGADIVVNVIGADQRLAQLQLKLSLLALGYRKEALNLVHYDYEIVRLPGRRMSSRRGEYVALDEVLEEAFQRSYREVKERNPSAREEWVRDTAWKVAVGAVRFALEQPGRLKPVTLDVEKMLNFRENSGPYLQYTYARANNILEKHGHIDFLKALPQALDEGLRRDLMVEALRFPVVSAKAADDLAPEDLASYLLRLADMFNKWYEKDPVIHEPEEPLRHAKAALVTLIRDTLGAGMNLLGVEPLPRM